MKYIIYKKVIQENTQIFGTEKAIRLPYSQKYFGKDIFNFKSEYESLWISRSKTDIYEISDGEHKYLYVKFPYWILTSKKIYPDWIENFDGYEIIEE